MGSLSRPFRAIAVVLAIVVGGVAAVALLRSSEAAAAGKELDFPTNRVHLTIGLRDAGADRAIVDVTFTPTVAQGHLYGTSMPRTGIDGAGRPTLVELVGDDWTASGPVVASVAARDQSLPGFSAPFPLYPDGPVTLSLPIRRASSTTATPATVALTFMVCTTSGLCFPPVERAIVEVPLGR